MESGLHRPVRFPDLYVWLVFVAALDAMMTNVVITLGGLEANPIANRVLLSWGFPGMVAYKFALIMLTIVLCEVIARRSERVARRLVLFGIALTCVPVVLALLLLAWAYLVPVAEATAVVPDA